MDKISGIKDLDFKILMSLDDKELGNICQVNKYINSLCKDNIFWLNRIQLKFGRSVEDIKTITKFLKNRHYIQTYIWIKEKDKILENFFREIIFPIPINIWMTLYERATGIVQSVEYSQDYFIDPIIEKIIKLSKGKAEAERTTIYRLFGFLWRIVAFSKKYKDIKENFMTLTK